MEIGRSLSEIDGKVKELNATLRESTAQTREMDKALKFDPKATEIATQRINTLKNAIGTATQKVALMKQKQLEANRAFEAGEIGATEFNKISNQVMRAENELRKFNAQLKNAQRTKLQGVAKEFDKVTSALKKTENVARAFSRLALGLVAAVGGAVVAFTKQTQELNEMANAYEISIEKLQLQRNIYEQITGDANNYNNSLDNLRKTLNKITLGQGQEYANILNHIGVSTTDAEGRTKSLNEIYDEIVLALSAMEDITLRNQLAYELFGEEAIAVLEIMELTAEQIEELNEKQIEQGLINEESAQTAMQIQEAWDAVKMEFMKVSAQLAQSLLPLIKELADFMIQFILPILTAIANWFTSMSPTQQKFVVFLIFLVIMLPMIIKFITMIVGVIKAVALACKIAAVGAGALSTASAPLIPILLAVAAVVLILALLFAFMTGQSKNLTKQLDSQKGAMDGMADSYSDMGGDMDMNATQTSHNSNTTTNDINVTIDSRGDNPIAEENAELVADLLAERINKELGGKI